VDGVLQLLQRQPLVGHLRDDVFADITVAAIVDFGPLEAEVVRILALAVAFRGSLTNHVLRRRAGHRLRVGRVNAEAVDDLVLHVRNRPPVVGEFFHHEHAEVLQFAAGDGFDVRKDGAARQDSFLEHILDELWGLAVAEAKERVRGVVVPDAIFHCGELTLPPEVFGVVLELRVRRLAEQPVFGAGVSLPRRIELFADVIVIQRRHIEQFPALVDGHVLADRPDLRVELVHVRDRVVERELQRDVLGVLDEVVRGVFLQQRAADLLDELVAKQALVGPSTQQEQLPPELRREASAQAVAAADLRQFDRQHERDRQLRQVVFGDSLKLEVFGLNDVDVDVLSGHPFREFVNVVELRAGAPEFVVVDNGAVVAAEFGVELREAL